MPGIDDNLESFEAQPSGWSGLLIGNGVSMSVSASFAYGSLFEQAKQSAACPMNDQDVALFDKLKTRNFEQVLSALLTAREINVILNLTAHEVSAAYERIQASLINAVKEVHVSWQDIDQAKLAATRECLLNYSYVYSTNYDLLTYWAINSNSSGFKDYIWGGAFDLGNTEIRDKVTKVLYLHGGLHLYKTAFGTRKRKSEYGANLLDLFGEPFSDGVEAVPLFITEGTSVDKLKSIYNNDYLAFAYNRFAAHEGPLLILGQSLAPEYDKHLIDAIRSSSNRVIGVGLYPVGKEALQIVKEKTDWLMRFAGFDVRFFDSRTHPLLS